MLNSAPVFRVRVALSQVVFWASVGRISSLQFTDLDAYIIQVRLPLTGVIIMFFGVSLLRYSEVLACAKLQLVQLTASSVIKKAVFVFIFPAPIYMAIFYYYPSLFVRALLVNSLGDLVY